MNHQVKKVLDQYVHSNLSVVKEATFSGLINQAIEDTKTALTFSSDTGKLVPYQNSEEWVKPLMNLKENKELQAQFELIKNLNINEVEIIENYKKQILNSYITIRAKVKEEDKGIQSQILFIEHDYEPVACFCGFGCGEYPLLNKPEYIDFNHKDELYNGVGKLDYLFWSNLEQFKENLEDDVVDSIIETKMFKAIQNWYTFKTYQLLHHAFDQLGLSLFEGIPTKLPFYIYGNEHDCEVMNIYVFEE